MPQIARHFGYLPLLALTLGACAETPAGTPPVRHPSVVAQAAGDAPPLGPSVLVTDALGSPHIGEPAPDFDLVDQSGSHVRLSELRGSVVVLAFVASFCPFSAAAQPSLARLTERYAPYGVRVIAIDVGEDEPAFQAYVSRMKLPFPVLHDPDAAVSLRFTPTHARPGVRDRSQVVVTSNLVIDRAGTIRFFTLLDTVHFDAKLVHLGRAVDLALQEG
jgi:peroxiredoxin Q/BCP